MLIAISCYIYEYYAEATEVVLSVFPTYIVWKGKNLQYLEMFREIDAKQNVDFTKFLIKTHRMEKYHKTRSCSKNSWNQLFSNFKSKNVNLTRKMLIAFCSTLLWYFFTLCNLNCNWINWFHVPIWFYFWILKLISRKKARIVTIVLFCPAACSKVKYFG